MPERDLAAQGGSVGFFGKVPVRGDFVRRALPQSFTTPWDRWLQAGIAGAKEILGEAWLEVYLTSPVWRFALAAHLAGDRAAAGVLIPSVDSVGRYFPLTVACTLQREAAPARIRAEAAWFDDAQALALGVLEEGAALEALIAGVGRLDPPEPPPLPADREGVQLGADDAGLVHGLIEGRAPPHGLFWTSGSERVQPTLILVWQLPSPRRFCALLDGAWTDHGWTQGS
jgi:type VI secretion system protein ImpM